MGGISSFCNCKDSEENENYNMYKDIANKNNYGKYMVNSKGVLYKQKNIDNNNLEIFDEKYDLSKEISRVIDNKLSDGKTTNKLNNNKNDETCKSLQSGNIINNISDINNNYTIIDNIENRFDTNNNFKQENNELFRNNLFKYNSNYRYKGEFKDRCKQGFGIQQWEEGIIYIGLFFNNKASIAGKFIHSNKDIYEGEFEEDIANGYGIYKHYNGATYEGNWLNDYQHGYGIETWADGSIYKGEYFKGKKSGYGIYKWYDGSAYKGEWYDNMLHGYVRINNNLQKN